MNYADFTITQPSAGTGDFTNQFILAIVNSQNGIEKI